MLKSPVNSLNGLLNAIDQPIYAVDLEGIFVQANEALAASRGLGLSELLGNHFSTGLSDVKAAQALLDRARGGEVVLGEIETLAPDGRRNRVLDRLGPWRDGEEIVGVWGIGVSPESAELQREAEVLRNVDEARRNLLSTVSHELRTPLAAIQGYASTYLLYEDRLSSEERRDFLQRIVNSTLQLEELIDNLLTASRIEHGTLQITPRPVQLTKLILEALGEAQMRTERQELLFTGPERCELTLDPRRIRQVIHNILDNAIKYGGDGQVEVELEDRDRDVVLTVADGGGGIAAGALPHLFERFYRAQSNGSAKGTGLGLWISKAIVEAHEGEMSVSSAPGEGTVFAITLPRGLAVPEA